MRPANEPAPATEKTRDVLRALAQTLTRDDAAGVAAYVALSLAAALAGSLAAVALVPLIQPAPVPLAGWLNMGSAGKQALVFFAASAVFALTRWSAARLSALLVGRYGMRLRRRVHGHLLDARLGVLADSTSAEIANVLTWNIEIIAQGFTGLLQLLIAAVTCIVSLAFAFWFCPQLIPAAPLFVLLGAMNSRVRAREQAKVGRDYVADMTSLFWLSEDFPRRVRHVRSFERSQAEKAHYAEIAARLEAGYRRQLDLAASGRLAIEIAAAAGIAAILLLARFWQGVDQASLIAAGLLFARLVPYLLSSRQNLQQMRAAAPAFDLWQRYVLLDSDHPPEEAEPPLAPLRIRHIRLVSNPVDIDVGPLLLVPGEMTLIAGDSGIGKSSLLDVLSGMVAPQIFDASAAQGPIGFAEYRLWVRNGAYVSQSVRPWQETIRECLRWAAPQASDEMLRAALTDVELKPALAQTRGEDALLDFPARRLSGGELQRLLLAQVLLRQPSVALLDETTSALDAASELAMLETLRRRLPHTVLLVVSHRGSVAAIADQCLTIGEGSRATLVRQAAHC